jgi:hypothetical protein
MTEVSVSMSIFGLALGIADADRIGASAKVQAANPINKNRFIRVSSLDAAIAAAENASPLGLFHE